MRNKRLDILRAVAVLLVLGRHADGPRVWKNVGWVGVDLFFVLSGFLISGLLFTEYQKTGGILWKRFFIRRGFKIYPAFYVMLLATALWQVASHHELHWKPFIPEIFFFQNYSSVTFWGHTWSLAVEEHFYILLPLLLLTMIALGRGRGDSDPFRWLPVVCLFLGVACLLQRLYLVRAIPDLGTSFTVVLFPSNLRIDSLFFGVFLGYLHHFHRSLLRAMTSAWPARVLLLLVSGFLISTCFLFPVESRFMLSFGLTALYLGFGGVLILSLYTRGGDALELPLSPKRFLLGDLAAFVGKFSYSIYLWHGMVIMHYQGFLKLIWPGIGAWGLFCGYILLSLFVGITLSLVIEYPALDLRDRLFPSLQSVKTLASQRVSSRPPTASDRGAPRLQHLGGDGEVESTFRD